LDWAIRGTVIPKWVVNEMAASRCSEGRRQGKEPAVDGKQRRCRAPAA
jgi:hypothetical protein